MNYDKNDLTVQIKQWGKELGFQQVGISGTDLGEANERLKAWLQKGYHADMHYLERNETLRSTPKNLVNETISIISVRLDYLSSENSKHISRYAVGRDYHKVVRKKLKHLAQRIEKEIGPFISRPFADSAPVFEKPIAEQAGIGWMGKNTLIINRNAGSYFFLGELYTNLDLTKDKPTSNHCGACTACIDLCPTKALKGPYQLDANLCISYLTIENKGSIPVKLRPLLGDRIFGCDECQSVCPWNKFAKMTTESDFTPRHNLDTVDLVELFNWSEAEYLKKTEGSALRRSGYIGWLRNIAVALGNATTSKKVIDSLLAKKNFPSALVQEHVDWALTQHHTKQHQN